MNALQILGFDHLQTWNEKLQISDSYGNTVKFKNFFMQILIIVNMSLKLKRGYYVV